MSDIIKPDNSLKVPCNQTWLYEFLEKRTNAPFNVPLSELFLLLPVPYGHNGEIDKELPFHPSWPRFKGGKLKIFFRDDIAKPALLWTRVFDYPGRSTHSRETFDITLGGYIKRDKDVKAHAGGLN